MVGYPSFRCVSMLLTAVSATPGVASAGTGPVELLHVKMMPDRSS